MSHKTLLLAFVLCSLAVIGAANHAGPVNVFLIPHSHCEAGSERTFEEYYEQNVTKILDTVVEALTSHKERKFVWAEAAFFQRWYQQYATDKQRKEVKDLISNKRFEFVGGGWIQSDEAVPSFAGVTEQLTFGHQFLNHSFGVRPRFGWQIDTFGASSLSPTIWKLMGFDGLVINRIGYQEKEERIKDSELEFWWMPSLSLGNKTGIFTHVLYENYNFPAELQISTKYLSEPIEEEEITEIAALLLSVAESQYETMRTRNVLIPWGDDFAYEDPDIFVNTEQIIAAAKELQAGDFFGDDEELEFNIQYGTLSDYFESVFAASKDVTFSSYQGDFFPYRDVWRNYYTGFYSSRPQLKGFIRQAESLLRSSGIISSLIHLSADERNHDRGRDQATFSSIDLVREQVAMLQDHHSITGTGDPVAIHDFTQRAEEAVLLAYRVIGNMSSLLLSQNPDVPPHGSIHRCSVTDIQTLIPVVLFNPLPYSRKEIVHVMIPSKFAKVTSGNGTLVQAQIILQTHDTVRMSPRKDNKPDTDTARELYFTAEVGPLGYATYFVELLTEVDQSVPTYLSRPKVFRFNNKYDIHNSSRLANKDITISNPYYQLVFDKSSGYLKTVENLMEQQKVDLSQNFVYYKTAEEDAFIFRTTGKQFSWMWFVVALCYFFALSFARIFRMMYDDKFNNVKPMPSMRGFIFGFGMGLIPSLIFGTVFGIELQPDGGLVFGVLIGLGLGLLIGIYQKMLTGAGFGLGFALGLSFAFFFRFEDLAEQVAVKNMGIFLWNGPLVTQLVQVYNPTLNAKYRLYQTEKIQGRVFEVVYNVSVQYNTQLITRYKTELANYNIFRTDNGLEMRQRQASPLEAVESNYYPMVSQAYISDRTLGFQFTVMSKQSLGVSSLVPGSLELMLHRQLGRDDHRNLAVPLSDLEEVPVTIWHSFMRETTSQRTRHLATQMLNHPLLVMCGKTDAPDLVDHWKQEFKTEYQSMNFDFPEAIELVSMQPRFKDSDQLAIRLHNMFEKDEDALHKSYELVDLKNAFKYGQPNGVQQLYLNLLDNEEDDTEIDDDISLKAWLAPMDLLCLAFNPN